MRHVSTISGKVYPSIGRSGTILIPNLSFYPGVLGTKILRWSHARSLSQFATGTTAGSGVVVTGANAGYWADLGPVGGAFIQSTASQKPVVRRHATKGVGGIVMGTGDIGAGGDYMATAATVAGIKYAYMVATPIGPDTTRISAGDPLPRWNENYHGFLGTSVIATSAVLYTGFNGTNNWSEYSLTGYTRDGTSISPAAADVGYGRRKYVYRVAHTTAPDTGNLNVLRHVGYDGFYARGGVHEVMVLGSSATAQELLQLDEYFQSYWLSGPQIIIAGDSIAAGVGVTETQGPAALLWEAYDGSVDCPVIAIPRLGVTSSVSPLTQTMTVDDPAKIAALAGRHSNVIVALAGTNDLATNRTAVQLYADIKTYTASMRALGYRVIVCTVGPRSDAGWTGAMETERVAYNLLMTGDNSWADGFVDVSTINPARQADGLHLTAAGTASVYTGAGGVKSVLDTLI